MKTFFGIVSTLIIGILIASFTYFVNRKYVDLRYTLSQKIPTKYIETSSAESIQLLTIANKGNIPATKIQVKINGNITEYTLRKNLISDVVKLHKLPKHFEAIYPSLPPDGKFSFIFKSTGKGITLNDLIIKGNNGIALEALDNSSKSLFGIFLSVFLVALVVLYIWINALSLRSYAIENLQSSWSYKDYDEYLNQRKPKYVSMHKWNKLRKEYIKKRFQNMSFGLNSIEDMEFYKILNQNKFDYLQEDEWNLLVDECSNRLVCQFDYTVNLGYKLEENFRVKKPKNLSDAKWNKICKNLNEGFINVQKYRQFIYDFDAKTVLNELKEKIPDGMLPDSRHEYESFLISIYYAKVKEEMLSAQNSLDYLDNVDFSFFNKSSKERLQNYAYKVELSKIDNISSLHTAKDFLKSERPLWLKQYDKNRLEEKANAYVNLNELTKNNESLFKVLHDILWKVELNKKPSSLNDEDWVKVVDLKKEFADAKEKILEDREYLSSEQSETQHLKKKVLKQLDIIDKLLSNPDSITKIEEYDNPFSEGNFKNLKKIHSLFK